MVCSFSDTVTGSGPYPTTSPRHTAASHFPEAAARAASKAVRLAWRSLRIRSRIQRSERAHMSIVERLPVCITGFRVCFTNPEPTKRITKRVRGDARCHFCREYCINLVIIHARLRCYLPQSIANAKWKWFFPFANELSQENSRKPRNIRVRSLVYTGAADFGAVQV